jgi:glycosyltransferase involved in cell wall biosynthesis
MISVLILTRNEEHDLPGCLASVAWSDDVRVLDSLSDDRTVEIAERHGATVHQRRFDNYAAQRNAGLHELPWRHPWVLILDADERIPAALAAEMRDFAAAPPAGVTAARMRRRDFLFDRWLAHCQMSPFYIRLVMPRHARYEREVNEVLRVEGAVHDLREPFDHYPFSKGMAHWIAKHNTYSTMEARCVIDSRRGAVPFSPRLAFTARDFNERRFHQKELFYRMPARPLVKFLYLYVVRRGFLDGRAGFTYAMLQSVYEWFIVLKTRELAAAESPVPPVTDAPSSSAPRGAKADQGTAR